MRVAEVPRRIPENRAVARREALKPVLPRPDYAAVRPTPRRAELLAAAVRVVMREDLPTASMDRIAEEAGVSRVTLYREFRNKASLFDAVVAYRLLQFDEKFFRRLHLRGDLGDLIEDYVVASSRMAHRNATTRRWVDAGTKLLRPGSAVHEVSMATWTPCLTHFNQDRAVPPEQVSAVVTWINYLQYLFSRAVTDNKLGELALRDILRTFVAPAFRQDMAAALTVSQSRRSPS